MKKARQLSEASPTLRAEFEAFDSDLAAIAATGNLPVMPTVLLTSGHHGLTVSGAAELEALWLEEQRRWAEAHPTTRQIVDPTHGHRLQEETPDAVVSAVEEVVHKVRGSP